MLAGPEEIISAFPAPKCRTTRFLAHFIIWIFVRFLFPFVRITLAYYKYSTCWDQKTIIFNFYLSLTSAWHISYKTVRTE